MKRDPSSKPDAMDTDSPNPAPVTISAKNGKETTRLPSMSTSPPNGQPAFHYREERAVARAPERERERDGERDRRERVRERERERYSDSSSQSSHEGGRDLASEHAKVHEAIGVSAVKETENTEIARGVTHDPQTGTKTHYRKSYLNSHSTI
jgi:hypothetical protein